MHAHGVGLVLIFSLAAAPSAAEEKKYTMKDLEALAKSESWSELGGHLEDIAPAQRSAKWKKIVEETALNQLQAEKEDNNPFAGLIVADGYTKRFVFLKKSRKFMDKRAEVGLKGFESCYQMSYSGGPCNERIRPFVEADPGNVQFALKAGQLVIRNQNHYFSIPFFRLAVVWAKGDKKTCEASRLMEALEAALGLPASYTKLVADAKETAKTCWPTLRGSLLAKLGGVTPTSYLATNLCPIVKEKKETSRKCK